MVNFLLLFLFSIGHLEAQACDGLSDLGREILKELNESSISCASNLVHLTFDDGPTTSVTPGILESLRTRNIKASFFVTTSRLKASPEGVGGLTSEILGGGHLLANHGHDHNAHALRMKTDGSVLELGLSQNEREEQIRESMRLLNEATRGAYGRQNLQWFRFPYGRGAMPSQAELTALESSGEITFSSSSYAERLREYRRISPALQTIAGQGLSHLGWNHDSGDSAIGRGSFSESELKDYVKRNLHSLCQRSTSPRVALFHDTKSINLRAIPMIADIGRCLGLGFISAEVLARNSGPLIESGVLIPQDQIRNGTVEQILRTLEQTESTDKPDCQSSTPSEQRTCYSSQFQRTYAHCTGGNSICFDGRWFSSTDPFVQQNCQIPE